MDTIWKNLPIELSEHICNQLPKVRRIPCDLKQDLRYQFFMVDKMLKYFTMWYGYDDAYTLLLHDLNMLNESDDVSPYDTWYSMDTDKRTEYYYSIMG
jgi:hypothetical protein